MSENTTVRAPRHRAERVGAGERRERADVNIALGLVIVPRPWARRQD